MTAPDEMAFFSCWACGCTSLEDDRDNIPAGPCPIHGKPKLSGPGHTEVDHAPCRPGMPRGFQEAKH